MKMMKFAITLMIALALALGLQSLSFASISSGAVTVSADVPLLTQALNVKIYPISVDAAGNDILPWGSPVSNMSGFGGLAPNFTYNIFFAAKYYAVDVSVVDNSGNEWYITHTTSSIKRGATTDNLDYNTNVAFSKVTKSPTDPTDPTKDIDTLLFKKVFAESAVTSSTALSKTALGGGWLRIRYGIATGEATKDATNAKPIGLDKRNGTYSGSVTITLSP